MIIIIFIPEYCPLRLQTLPCHLPHILPKFSCPNISPWPPPHFYWSTSNHLHFYTSDAKTISICHAIPHQPHIEYHRRSQHEARGGNCLLLNFQINNDFASCFASSNKIRKWSKFQPITMHKLVFVLQRCTTKTLQQWCRIQKFPRGNTPDLRFRMDKVCFCSPKIYWNSIVLQQCKIQQNFLGH